MRRGLTMCRLRLPWWLFVATRPGPALRMDWWFLHGWGRRPAPPRAVRAQAAPPVPTPMLWFPLRCTGAEDCPSCAAFDAVVEVVAPLVDA